MNTTEAARLARSLMKQHGLGHVPFEFDRAVRRLGQTRFRRGPGGWQVHSISLSRPITMKIDEPKVRNVILHEIAHAMAGPKAHHGPEWRKIARQIGCTGDRCETLLPEQQIAPKYVAICPGCKFEGGARHRRPKNGLVYLCTPCHKMGIKMPVRWVLA